MEEKAAFEDVHTGQWAFIDITDHLRTKHDSFSYFLSGTR